MVSRVPLQYRSCYPCAYHYIKKNDEHWCSKFNEEIIYNRAKDGCLGFTVERQTRVMGGLMDAPEGRNINKQLFGYDAEGNETIKSYQDDVLLFTVTFIVEDGVLTGLVRTDAKILEVGKEEKKEW